MTFANPIVCYDPVSLRERESRDGDLLWRHYRSMEIQFTTRIFREGKTFVAYAQELDISSCGRTKEKAFANLKEAVGLFLEEAEKMGTLETILEEAGYKKTKATLQVPKPISVQRVSLPVPLTHVKI